MHEDGFGLLPSDEVDSPEGFAAFVARLQAESHPRDPSSDGAARWTAYRWIVDSDRVLGGIAIRFGDDEHTSWAGHIGYGIRPADRGRGVAGWALRTMLPIAREHGAHSLLGVCAADNIASATTMERSGGVRDGVHDTALGPALHYRFSF